MTGQNFYLILLAAKKNSTTLAGGWQFCALPFDGELKVGAFLFRFEVSKVLEHSTPEVALLSQPLILD